MYCSGTPRWLYKLHFLLFSFAVSTGWMLLRAAAAAVSIVFSGFATNYMTTGPEEAVSDVFAFFVYIFCLLVAAAGRHGSCIN